MDKSFVNAFTWGGEARLRLNCAIEDSHWRSCCRFGVGAGRVLPCGSDKAGLTLLQSYMHSASQVAVPVQPSQDTEGLDNRTAEYKACPDTQQ